MSSGITKAIKRLKDKPKKKPRKKVSFASADALERVVEISIDEDRSPFSDGEEQYFEMPEIDGNRILGNMLLFQIDPALKRLKVINTSLSSNHPQYDELTAVVGVLKETSVDDVISEVDSVPDLDGLSERDVDESSGSSITECSTPAPDCEVIGVQQVSSLTSGLDIEGLSERDVDESSNGHSSKKTTPLGQGVMATDQGVMATEQGVMATEQGVMATEQGVMATEQGVMATEQGVVIKNLGVGSLVANNKESIIVSREKLVSEESLLSKEFLVSGEQVTHDILAPEDHHMADARVSSRYGSGEDSVSELSESTSAHTVEGSEITTVTSLEKCSDVISQGTRSDSPFPRPYSSLSLQSVELLSGINTDKDIVADTARLQLTTGAPGSSSSSSGKSPALSRISLVDSLDLILGGIMKIPGDPNAILRQKYQDKTCECQTARSTEPIISDPGASEQSSSDKSPLLVDELWDDDEVSPEVRGILSSIPIRTDQAEEEERPDVSAGDEILERDGDEDEKGGIEVEDDAVQDARSAASSRASWFDAGSTVSESYDSSPVHAKKRDSDESSSSSDSSRYSSTRITSSCEDSTGEEDNDEDEMEREEDREREDGMSPQISERSADLIGICNLLAERIGQMLGEEQGERAEPLSSPEEVDDQSIDTTESGVAGPGEGEYTPVSEDRVDFIIRQFQDEMREDEYSSETSGIGTSTSSGEDHRELGETPTLRLGDIILVTMAATTPSSAESELSGAQQDVGVKDEQGPHGTQDGESSPPSGDSLLSLVPSAPTLSDIEAGYAGEDVTSPDDDTSPRIDEIETSPVIAAPTVDEKPPLTDESLMNDESLPVITTLTTYTEECLVEVAHSLVTAALAAAPAPAPSATPASYLSAEEDLFEECEGQETFLYYISQEKLNQLSVDLGRGAGTLNKMQQQILLTLFQDYCSLCRILSLRQFLRLQLHVWRLLPMPHTLH